MFDECLPLLRYKARIVHRKVQNFVSVPYDDCLGESFVIFCETLEKYDPSRGASFKTYLTHRLRNLEKKILYTNRMSSVYSNRTFHPSGIHENIPHKQLRIPIEELSSDGRQIVGLLLDGSIGGDYGSGKGKKLPGKKRIAPYMKKHFDWSYRKTETVIEEIQDWWRN